MVGNEGEDSVVLYLRMEDRDDPTVVFDNSNQGNNMTIHGAAFVEDCDAPIDKGDGDKVKTLRQLVLGWDKDGKEAVENKGGEAGSIGVDSAAPAAEEKAEEKNEDKTDK